MEISTVPAIIGAASTRDIPTQVLIELAKFHGTSIDYLLGLTDVKEGYPKAGAFHKKNKN